MIREIRLLPNIHEGGRQNEQAASFAFYICRLFVIISKFAIDGRVVIIVKCSWDNYFDCNCLAWLKQL